MIRLEEAALYAASKSSAKSKRSLPKVDYVWKYDQIYISFVGRPPDDAATHKKCNEVRREFIKHMAAVWPSAPDDLVRLMLAGRVSRWFSHKGFKSPKRDEKLGEKLSRMIWLDVSILSGKTGIVCGEAITEFDAPSGPLDLKTKEKPRG